MKRNITRRTNVNLHALLINEKLNWIVERAITEAMTATKTKNNFSFVKITAISDRTKLIGDVIDGLPLSTGNPIYFIKFSIEL